MYATKAKELSQKSAAEAKRAEREAREASGRGRRAEAGVLSSRRLAHAGCGPARPTEPAAIAVEDRMYRWLAVLRFVLRRQRGGPQPLPRAASPTRSAGAGCWRRMVVWTVRGQLGLRRLRAGVRRAGSSPTSLVALAAIGADRRASRSRATTRPCPGFWVMGAMLAWAIHWRWHGRAGRPRSLLSVADLADPALPHRDHLRQPLPAAGRRPDRRPHGRLAAADRPRERDRRRARGRGRGRAHPAGPRRARRRAAGARPGAAPRPRARRRRRRARPAGRRAGGGAARADPAAGRRSRPDSGGRSTWSGRSSALERRARRRTSPRPARARARRRDAAERDRRRRSRLPRQRASPTWARDAPRVGAARGPRRPVRGVGARRGSRHRRRAGSRRPRARAAGRRLVDPRPDRRPRRYRRR